MSLAALVSLASSSDDSGGDSDSDDSSSSQESGAGSSSGEDEHRDDDAKTAATASRHSRGGAIAPVGASVRALDPVLQLPAEFRAAVAPAPRKRGCGDMIAGSAAAAAAGRDGDAAAAAQGKKVRAVAHTEGTFPSHVFLPVTCQDSAAVASLCQRLIAWASARRPAPAPGAGASLSNDGAAGTRVCPGVAAPFTGDSSSHTVAGTTTTTTTAGDPKAEGLAATVATEGSRSGSGCGSGGAGAGLVALDPGELHISLSRPFYLQRHHITAFVDSLRAALLGSPGGSGGGGGGALGSVGGRGAARGGATAASSAASPPTLHQFTYALDSAGVVLANEQRTRGFLTAPVTVGQREIGALIDAVDGPLAQFNQPRYYEERLAHVSVAWSTDPAFVARAGDVVVAPRADGGAASPATPSPLLDATAVCCKVGSRVFHLELPRR